MVDAMIALKDGHLWLPANDGGFIVACCCDDDNGFDCRDRVSSTSVHSGVMGLSNHRVCRVSGTSVRSSVMGSSICWIWAMGLGLLVLVYVAIVAIIWVRDGNNNKTDEKMENYFS
jgi:hypothetical protein